MDLRISAIVAGIMFGIWPLLMNRSGLTGNVSATVFTAVVLCVVLSTTFYNGIGELHDVHWVMAIGAGLAGGVGLLSFNGMLSRASKESVGFLFILTLLAQMSLPAIYQLVITGGDLPVRKLIGLLVAVIAAILLA